MKKIIAFFVVLFFTVLITLISGCVAGTDDSALENSIVWIGTPPAESGVIEVKIIQQVIPYAGTEYEIITIDLLRNTPLQKNHAPHLPVLHPQFSRTSDDNSTTHTISP